MIKHEWIKWVAILVGLCLAAGSAEILLRKTSLGETLTWQRLTSPGPLSKAHSFLENNCAACHTPVKGPDAGKCIACHASNDALLQRQPTSFHGYIDTCCECHIEHQGIKNRPSVMDHVLFAKIGLHQLEVEADHVSESKRLHKQLSAWIRKSVASEAPALSPYEAVLNCATCHAKQDRHFKLFGENCALCHSTSEWTISRFRHPSPRSMDCAQCHQAPPSHYMEHFRMISAKVADQPFAKVNQCYLCHQTTSWNDIKGVGWYKHH